MPSGAVELDEVGLLARTEFGLLAAQPAFALATAMPSRVRARARSASNSAIMLRVVNSSRPIGSVGSCTEPPMLSLHTAGGEFVNDVARVGDGPGEPVELGHDERVAAAAGGERLAQPGSVAVRARQAVVDIDPLRVHAERGERVALHSEVLIDRRHAGVADL